MSVDGGCVGKPQENMSQYTIALNKQREKKQQGKNFFYDLDMWITLAVCVLLRKPSKK